VILQHSAGWPSGRVGASVFRAPDLTIHANVFEALGALGAKQQEVDAKAAVAFPALTHVIPVRVHGASVHIAMVRSPSAGIGLPRLLGIDFRCNQKANHFTFGRDVAL
jgi:hypothetical protein